MNRWVGGLALVLSAALVIAIQIRQNERALQEASAPSSVASESAAVVEAADLPTGETDSNSGTATTSNPTSNAGGPSTGVDPKFQSWLSQEAKKMDQPRVDEARTRKELREVMSELTPVQSQVLLKTALHTGAPAGERILSAYLLVEGGSRSLNELRQFIAAPLPDHGPAEAHSHAEAASVREKSLRILAIDGLFARAHTDASARQALAKAISDTQDPYVRAYAQERLNRLNQQ